MSRLKIYNPLTQKELTEDNIASCLFDMAGQENCDGDPYDQMQFAGEIILDQQLRIKWLLEHFCEGEHPDDYAHIQESLIKKMKQELSQL